MKPEEYTDENRVPAGEDSTPGVVDEKEQLRKSIHKSCSWNVTFYVILAILFAINGIVKFDEVSDSKLYLCPLIACITAAAVLGLIDKSPWYVAVLAAIGIITVDWRGVVADQVHRQGQPALRGH